MGESHSFPCLNFKVTFQDTTYRRSAKQVFPPNFFFPIVYFAAFSSAMQTFYVGLGYVCGRATKIGTTSKKKEA
jgi:hypothetical protein